MPTATEVSTSSQPSASVKTRDPPIKSRPKGNYPNKVLVIFFKPEVFFLRTETRYTILAFQLSMLFEDQVLLIKGHSLYLCPYEDRCGPPPYSGDIASAGSHVRRHHLGHCIQCRYDGSRFYNGAGWRDHMLAKHAKAPWYRSELGIDCDMPEKLFRVKSSDPLNQRASVSASAPSVPDNDVKTPSNTLLMQPRMMKWLPKRPTQVSDVIP